MNLTAKQFAVGNYRGIYNGLLKPVKSVLTVALVTRVSLWIAAFQKIKKNDVRASYLKGIAENQ